MNRIILVGNGFDLAHNLPTSYKDFINWYWEERWERMMSSRSLLDDDNLCRLKLKPGVVYRSWREYDSYNHLEQRFTASERFDFIKQLLIIPIFCVARLIHLDWRMMENNRILSDIKNQSKRQLDKLNEKQMWTNMQSLEVILESLVTTVIFIFVLLK